MLSPTKTMEYSKFDVSQYPSEEQYYLLVQEGK